MPQVTPLSRLLSPREVAERWACKVDRVLDLVHSGALPATNIGRGAVKGRYRIDPADLARFEESRRVPPPGRRGRRPSKPKRPAGWVEYFK